MTAVKLREWRGVKPVAGPAGVAISTRLRTTPEDERVLDLVAEHLGGLRRADLAAVSRPRRWIRRLDDEAQAAGAPGSAQHPQEGVDRAVECAVGQRDHRRQRRPVPAGPRRPAPPHHRAAGGDRHHREATGRTHRRHPHPGATQGAPEGQAAEGLCDSGGEVSETAPAAGAARRAGPGVRRPGRPPCAGGRGR